ncbi:MAG: hypothetical protein JST38_14430 [Bacteroidetes bacterium]|nr:hypothetical protein [Bacteroidota bacterium]
MATDKTIGLINGDLQQVWKITKLMRMGPQGKGFSYDYVVSCLDADDPRQNADILAIAQRIVADRKRSMEALAAEAAKKAAKKQQRKHAHKGI